MPERFVNDRFSQFKNLFATVRMHTFCDVALVVGDKARMVYGRAESCCAHPQLVAAFHDYTVYPALARRFDSRAVLACTFLLAFAQMAQ